jgi:hypothetical protein
MGPETVSAAIAGVCADDEPEIHQLSGLSGESFLTLPARAYILLHFPSPGMVRPCLNEGRYLLQRRLAAKRLLGILDCGWLAAHESIFECEPARCVKSPSSRSVLADAAK